MTYPYKMESFLKTNYSDIMSLGSNCFPKFFISKILKPANGETQIFDYIGASMWSINALIRADFQDLTNPADFANIPVVKKMNPVVTNTKYYMRFLHDLTSVAGVQNPEFVAKMQRRVDRFTGALCDPSSNILYIRYQENQVGRIIYPTNPVADEYDELVSFVALVKEKYGAKATVIYINTDKEGWNDAHTILSIKIPSLTVSYKIIHTKIKELFIKKNIVAQLSKGLINAI